MHVPRTKVAVPDPPPDFVPRPELRERLDEAAPTDLVVVCAPAGYGKTVVLADWARHHRDTTAWVTVDGTDNDPRRLWTAVRAALASRAGASLPERDGVGASVDGLIAALDGLRHPVVLVLDDLHELSRPEVLHDLARLVRLRPPTLRMVLASRVDPPLSLSRQRLDGRLCEIRAEHLRFSADGAAALLRSAGLTLSAAQVEALLARTDGWAAGLRLAAFTLRHSDDPDRFLADFSGDERSVADYLTGEVLAGLDGDTLDVLRAVSVCAPLSAGLAVHLSGRPDAQVVLERVRQETGLVERGGAREYRLHALLRTYLLAELRRRRPLRHDELHARAARWRAERGEARHALRHAARSGDAALQGELLHRFAAPLLLGGELDTFRDGLRAAGPSRPADPEVSLLAAVAHLERRDRDTAAAELERVRDTWPSAPTAELTALRAGVELLAAAAGVRTAVTEPPAGPPPPVASGAILHLGRASHLLRAPGDRPRACAELDQALTLARRHGFAFLEVSALTLLAAAHALQGDIAAVARTATQALATSTERGQPAPPWTSAPAALLAYAELLRARPRDAVERAGQALGGSRLLPEVEFTLHAVHAAGRADRGEGVAGLAEARAARLRHDDIALPAEWIAALAVLEHRAAVLLGNTGAARAVAAWLERRAGPVGETVLMHAWAEAAEGRPDTAAATVVPLLDGTVPVLLSHTALEATLLLAEARLHAGDGAAGQARLRDALARGRALEVVRPFALAGPATRNVLAGWARRPGRDRFTARVGQALADVHPEIAAPLSGRETAVLDLLPTLLSAREIADELTLSVNTVKTHVRAIYRKLGVSSRREAVLRARRRGLLP